MPGRRFRCAPFWLHCRLAELRATGGRFRQRHIELLHRSQRLAQTAAQLRRRLANCIQHLLLAVSRHLLLRQWLAALAIHRLQSQHILVAEGGNRAENVGLTVGTLAKLPRDLRRQLCIGRARHQLQGRRNFVIGEHIQKRRLVESDRERSLQGVVKTGSPVLLTKSAITMVSFSVSRGV